MSRYPDRQAGIVRLHQSRGYLFDMDGTLALGDKNNQGLKAIDGAIELLTLLDRKQIPWVIFTNGTTRSPAHYASTLRDAGLPVSNDRMMTPVSSAIETFQAHQHQKVLVLGGDGLLLPLREAGFEAIHIRDTCAAEVAQHAFDAVLTGWYQAFSMDDLYCACLAVESGAELFSSSDALYFAAASGRALGTSRVMAAVIREVTGVSARVVGKPSLEALQCAANVMGIEAQQVVVVGDDPVLEVPMANMGKACGIAVNSGLGNADSYRELPAGGQPHLILENVRELLQLLD